MKNPNEASSAGRAPGRSQAGPHPLGGSADVPIGRGADIQSLQGGDRRIPFLDKIGMRRVRIGGGEAVVTLELQPDLLNNHGAGHGGVLMTLLDSAMANAALSRVDFSREVVTVDLHVGFMHPSKGRLAVTGRATGGGRSVCFCEAEAIDASGQVVAKAMGTFRYLNHSRPE